MKRIYQLATVFMLILIVMGTSLTYAEEIAIKDGDVNISNVTEGEKETVIEEGDNVIEGEPIPEEIKEEIKEIKEEVDEEKKEETAEHVDVKEDEKEEVDEEKKEESEEVERVRGKEKIEDKIDERIMKEIIKTAIKREDILKKNKFKALKLTDTKKLEKLKDKELKELAKLEGKKLKKLSKLAEEKIAKLAKLEHKNLRKLAKLEDSELDKLSELDEVKLKKIGKLSREEIKRLALKNLDELAKIDFDEEINKKDKFRKESFSKRKIDKKKREEAKEDFKKAKELRKKAKKQLDTARKEFLSAKKATAACEGVNTTECDEVRDKIRTQSKTFLLHTADIIISELEKVKSKLEDSEDLSEEEVVEWVANIDSKIEEVEKAKTTIETAETKEEIMDAAQAIKREWLFTKHQMKKLVGLLTHKKVRGIITKADILEERLNEVLSNLEENEVDTAEIDDLVDEFSEKIAKAKDEYELAEEKWAEVEEIKTSYTNITPEDLKKADSLLKEAKDHVKESHAALREAQDILKKIGRLVKDSGAHITDSDKPDYAPGEDLGYFIWQGEEDTWTVCLSGDGEAHVGKGTIKADEGFAKVKPLLYERRTDRYRILDIEIAFRSWVKPHQDCLRLATASGEVTFNLYIDGEQTDQIFVGKDKNQHTSPVTLTGDPCTKCIEEPETAEVEGGYELVECATSEECTEEGATCSTDGVCVIETEEVEE